MTKSDAADVPKATRPENDPLTGLVISDGGRVLISTLDTKKDAPIEPFSLEPKRSTRVITDAPVVRSGTKQALVVDLLRGDNGASIGELTDSTGWLPHTTRAALTGLRKRGFEIETEKADGMTRYRLAAGGRL